MPTADRSQTSRKKISSGKELSTSNAPATFNFSALPGTPATISVPNGYSNTTTSDSGPPREATSSSIIAFYINFNNGTSTRVAIGAQTRWAGDDNPFTLFYKRTRIELANGPPPSPITGTFTPTAKLYTTILTRKDVFQQMKPI